MCKKREMELFLVEWNWMTWQKKRKKENGGI
jgi:hypothetical protein